MSNRMSKAEALRRLLVSQELTFLMEAHNGLSARIVEGCGFSGIWASGLAISSSLGLRDCNEASWTQVLDVVDSMNDSSTIPILVDGDSGYGNFNNVRRLVRKLSDRGIAGVCIEDKLFPKQNSFIGEEQPLLEIGEFCGKIRAAKDSQTDIAFCVVARTEALVSSRPLAEALDRAEAYREAGADAVLVHSKRRDTREILSFLLQWERRSPVVLVPTMYHTTPVDILHAAGATTIIWPNQNVRACIAAMRAVTAHVFVTRSISDVEDQVASMADLFALLRYDELSIAQDRYCGAGSDAAESVAIGRVTGDRS